MIVYHYTEESAYNQIIITKELRPSFFSTSLDCTYGEGWYFTDLKPNNSDKDLCQLWGQDVPERTRCYIEFDIHLSFLQNTRSHVYRLPLQKMKEPILRLDTTYYNERPENIVIRHTSRGKR
jgi:hypothetical protein